MLSISIETWISVVSLFYKFWFIWIYASTCHLCYWCIFLSASHMKLHFRSVCHQVIENGKSFAPKSTCFLSFLPWFDTTLLMARKLVSNIVSDRTSSLYCFYCWIIRITSMFRSSNWWNWSYKTISCRVLQCHPWSFRHQILGMSNVVTVINYNSGP